VQVNPRQGVFAGVTSHDVLKFIAVALMIADHVGFFFFSYDLWWRGAGRLCVPIWLFLIGYSRTTRIDAVLIGSAAFLIVLTYVLGQGVIPLNILVTIILVRLIRDPLLHLIGTSVDRLFLVFAFCAVFAPATQIISDYGTLAVLFALCGSYARNGFGGGKNIPVLLSVATSVLFVACQAALFEFSAAQTAFVTIGTAAVMAALFHYLPRTAPQTHIRSPFMAAAFRWTGRHTLAIYVGHLALFKIVAFLLYGVKPLQLIWPF
jgi:hypothetical protein